MNKTSGFTFMLNFIRDNKSDIPENLRALDSLTDENGAHLAMHWVYIMKRVPVPLWMRCDPNAYDSHGWSVAFHYTYANKSAPPEWMKCDSEHQNAAGKTIGMMFMLYAAPTESFPEWMECSTSIRDAENYTIVDYWIIARRDSLPRWIADGIDLSTWKNRDDLSVPEMWLKYRHEEYKSHVSDDEDTTSIDVDANEEEENDEMKEIMNMINA